MDIIMIVMLLILIPIFLFTLIMFKLDEINNKEEK